MTTRVFKVNLTGHQLRYLLDLADHQDDCEITIWQMDEWIDPETKEVCPAGLYASYTDYLDEGLTYLAPEPVAPSSELNDTPAKVDGLQDV